jgi:hypothetical protein
MLLLAVALAAFLGLVPWALRDVSSPSQPPAMDGATRALPPPPPADDPDTCAVLPATSANRDWCPEGVPVRVAARSLGCATGVRLAAGQRFVATPRPGDAWYLQQGPPADPPTGRPETSPFAVRSSQFVSHAPGAPYGALVGSTTGCPSLGMAVGDGAEHTSACAGELTLVANDNEDPGCSRYGALQCAHDNHGAIHVCVRAGAMDDAAAAEPTPLAAQPAPFVVEGVQAVRRDGACTWLSATGTHGLPAGAVVRAFLEDVRGAFYPQHPPVSLSGGRWTMAGLRRCRDIVAVRFVRLSAAGEREVQARVDAQQFGAMGLPVGSSELARYALGR